MRGNGPGHEVQKTRAVREHSAPGAEQKVRRELILEAIAAREELAVTDEELAAEIAKIARRINKPAGRGAPPARGDGLPGSIEEHMRDEKTLRSSRTRPR